MTRKLKNSIRLALTVVAFLMTLIGAMRLMQLDAEQYEETAITSQSSDTAQVNTALTGCTATVRVRLLNQRSGPNLEATVIGGAGRGESFTVTAWDDTGEWVLVETASGSAWMYADYMTLSETCGTIENVTVSSSGVVASATPSPTLESEIVMTNGTSDSSLSPIFTDDVQYWATLIEAWAVVYQMDANLIATVIQIESCGNATITSSAGAQGLFQVMPFHFAAGEDMLDVQTNAQRGLDYLAGALELAHGDVGLALVGYNGGYGAITGTRYAETNQYYYWGSNIYAEAISGMTTSPTLAEWLAAGGSILCEKARASQSVIE
ncbi:MAG: transglycosylase SLT domain-containing protein [Anaerolineae bacterium]|nr:transglycosylase SLT domain-containing protein [Anaerolineae bacterium]